MHYLKKVILTADRIDYWIRRHVIQYWCETNPSQHKLNPIRVKAPAQVTLFGSDEQMFGRVTSPARAGK